LGRGSRRSARRSRGSRKRSATPDTVAGSGGGARTCGPRRVACFVAPRRTRLRRVRIVLEAVPNVSEGRSPDAIAAIAETFASDALLLDVHSDPDHNRSVFTLAGDPED